MPNLNANNKFNELSFEMSDDELRIIEERKQAYKSVKIKAYSVKTVKTKLLQALDRYKK